MKVLAKRATLRGIPRSSTELRSYAAVDPSPPCKRIGRAFGASEKRRGFARERREESSRQGVIRVGLIRDFGTYILDLRVRELQGN